MSTSTLRGRLGARVRGDQGVQVVDTPTVRVHHPGDLVGAILALLGIGAVLVLAVYAQGTTSGLTEDVRGFATILRRLLFIPVAVLEGLITFIAPLAVLTELALRRLVRQAFEAIAAAVVGTVLALVAAWIITVAGGDELFAAFSVWTRGERVVTIPALLAGTAALLTASGARNRRRTLPWSWNLLWIGLGVALITGLVTLPGALLTVLIGRVTGLTIRYASGVQSERAYGDSLVAGVQRAGLEPASLVRVRDVASDTPQEDSAARDWSAVALTRSSDNRVYALTTDDGDRLDVVVLDGDRQVVGVLTRFWRSLRMRGLDGRGVISLRQAAERTALVAQAAWTAGVCTPRLLGIAESEDSMLLVQEHAAGAVPLRDMAPEDLTDEVLDAIWEQLSIAHRAGIAHRSITADVVLIDPTGGACRRSDHDGHGPAALLTGWASGDVASSELARRLDVAQLLAVLALRVGPDRAVDSAERVLPDKDLATTGPLLQSIALPRATREEARSRRGLLAEVREALLAKLPEADVEPERLVRFGMRTVLMLVLSIAAVAIVVTTIGFEEIATAFAAAEPYWVAVSFGMGMLSLVGGAIALVAFAPVRLSLYRTTLVQAAAAFVALMAPAGVGPAALNLRMLTRKGVGYPLAVASVGLVQLSQFVSTIALLLVLSVVSGQDSALQQLPPATVLVAVGLALGAVAAAMLVPRVRQWVTARIVPVWRQTWPRLVQLLSEPRRFAIAVAGNLLVTIGYLGAFYAALAAFGQAGRLSLIDMAIIYLIGNAAGAAVPTPGGLGTVEAALVGGLVAGGIPAALATSVVVLFRALTFWARIPVGWLAMRALQRRGDL
jgi:glycosyltransferase 2 family protein